MTRSRSSLSGEKLAEPSMLLSVASQRFAVPLISPCLIRLTESNPALPSLDECVMELHLGDQENGVLKSLENS